MDCILPGPTGGSEQGIEAIRIGFDQHTG
jgi:hypothetical protein